jgi:hypothetical protein
VGARHGWLAPGASPAAAEAEAEGNGVEGGKDFGLGLGGEVSRWGFQAGLSGRAAVTARLPRIMWRALAVCLASPFSISRFLFLLFPE